MVLAAGRGERMRPLTDRVPKPVLRVGGDILVGYQLRILAAAGITDVVMNCAWQADVLREALGNGSRWGVDITWSPEPWPALDTGGGILQALPLLGPEPFVLVNGDVWCQWTPKILELSGDLLGQLMLVPNPPHNPAGDFGLEEGKITTEGGDRHTYGGIALLSPQLFSDCRPGRFPLAPVLREAALGGRLSGTLHQGPWLDVGTPERLYVLQDLLAES